MRHALTSAAGAAHPDRALLATAFDLRCAQLRTRLHPLFGAPAIGALFERALHLATPEFPWLVRAIPKNAEACSLEALHLETDTLQPDSIAEGLAAVLAYDIELLTTFIGKDFVVPLIQEAWGTALPADSAAHSEGDHE